MASTLRYRVALTCSNCGALNEARAINLYTTGMGSEETDSNAYTGSAHELELEYFTDSFLTLRDPVDEQNVVALEIWDCHACHRLRVARLAFRRRTLHVTQFLGAETSSFSTDALREANFVSRRIDEWAVEPGDDATRIAELEALL